MFQNRYAEDNESDSVADRASSLPAIASRHKRHLPFNKLNDIETFASSRRPNFVEQIFLGFGKNDRNAFVSFASYGIFNFMWRPLKCL